MNADLLFQEFLRNLFERFEFWIFVDQCCAVNDRGCSNPAVGYRKPAMGFYLGSNLQDIWFTRYPLNSERIHQS